MKAVKLFSEKLHKSALRSK